MKYILFKIAANSHINFSDAGSMLLPPSGLLDAQEYGDEIFIVNNKDFLYFGVYKGKNDKGEWIVENVKKFPIKIFSNPSHTNITASFHRTLIYPGANQGSQILTNQWKITAILEFLNGDDKIPAFQKWLGLKNNENN